MFFLVRSAHRWSDLSLWWLVSVFQQLVCFSWEVQRRDSRWLTVEVYSSKGVLRFTWWKFDVQWWSFARCFFGGRKSWCHSGSTWAGVASMSVTSPARESNDTVATKCERLICGFSQGSMILRSGLRHGSNEGFMVFIRDHWLIFMQGVW